MWITLIGMLAYGVLHTLLAGWFKPRFRARFGERAYYGLYRILFNTIVTITLAPVALAMLIEDSNAPVIWQFPTRAEPVLMAIQLAGMAGMAVSLLQIDGMRFLGVTQLMAYLRGAPLPLADEPLQTGGVYRLVRHPLYLFSILVMWPVTVMRGAYFGFCLGATLYFVVGSLYEERRLAQGFGQAYEDYRERVAWLIPLVRLPRRASR